jgi:hypothetical protein
MTSPIVIPKIPRRRHPTLARRRRRPTAGPQLAAGLVALMLMAAPALADVIHYKDGRKLEGRIVSRTATELTVETDFGKIKVPLSKVERIEEKRTPREELEARRALVAAEDAAALFELALWARDQELAKEYAALLREVIAAKPEHVLANELLGRVKLDGRWFEPDELDAYVRSVEEEQRAKGLLFHEGRWQPEEQVMAARGFLRYGDRWLPRRDAETALASQALADRAGLELTATAGATLTLYSALPAEHAQELLEPLEAEVAWFLDAVAPTGEERERLLRYDIPIVLVPDTAGMDRAVSSGALVGFGLGEALHETYRHSTNFTLYWPRPLIVLVASGDHVKVTGDVMEGRLGLLSHQLARVLVERFKGDVPAPPWVVHGMAALLEGRVNHYATLSVTSPPRGESGEAQDPFVQDWEAYTAWAANLADERKHVQIPPLRTILRQRTDAFDSREVGICWGLLRYLLARRSTEFAAYLRAYGTTPGARGKDAALLHEAAWDEAFADPLAAVEADWRQWALTQPPVPR